jgi:ABC-type transport system involved in cytochrome c biogenesis permease subunit
MNRALFIASCVIVLLFGSAQAQEVSSPSAWTEETVSLAREVPVQHGGRVKPLGTYAGFQLLRMQGKRTLKTPSGAKLGPTAWMLDVLFRPTLAMSYECFRIRNDDLVIAMGVKDPSKRKSDYYSYYQLEPGIEALFLQADAATRVAPGDRDLDQNQALELASNVRDFLRMSASLDFARGTLPLTASPALSAIFGDDPRSGVTVLLEGATQLRELWGGLDSLSPAELAVEQSAAVDLSGQLDTLLAPTEFGLALFAPSADTPPETEWLNVGDAVMLAFGGVDSGLKSVASLTALEDLVGLTGDMEAFGARFAVMHAGLVERAALRGDYDYVPLEVRFYKGDFFYRALLCFVFSFLFCATSWLLPKSVWVVRGIWATLLGGTGLLVLGIVLRCIIRERPPVSTLYETILFITAICVIVAISIEAMNRQRIAQVVAAFLGAAGMFLSMKYELKEAASAGDTMPSLVAVLDTNFWLSTHVTTVTMGYAAGLLASALAHVWLFGQMFGVRREDKAGYKSLSRMVYGVTCFGLLFATVGTILGGIWANYSWGRFWGWDPKENGALLIVLWMILTLHSRMGGYVRDFGFCVLAVVGGTVVAFSWWGVNLLGVGLHSYGFTSGVGTILITLYAVEALVVVSALGWRALSSSGAVEA